MDIMEEGWQQIPEKRGGNGEGARAVGLKVKTLFGEAAEMLSEVSLAKSV